MKPTALNIMFLNVCLTEFDWLSMSVKCSECEMLYNSPAFSTDSEFDYSPIWEIDALLEYDRGLSY